MHAWRSHLQVALSLWFKREGGRERSRDSQEGGTEGEGGRRVHINLSQDFDELANIIHDSYIKFKRTYVFTDYNNKNKQKSIHCLYKRMINLFSFTGKRVGVNILRSSYLTYQLQLKQAQGKILTVAD